MGSLEKNKKLGVLGITSILFLAFVVAATESGSESAGSGAESCPSSGAESGSGSAGSCAAGDTNKETCVEKNPEGNAVNKMSTHEVIRAAFSLDSIADAIGKSEHLQQSVKSLCQSTDFKELCEKSLAKANHSHDPRKLMNAAFSVAWENLAETVSHSELLKRADKDPRTHEALDICKEVLDLSIRDLKRSSHKVEGSTTMNAEEGNILRIWLSAAITFEETCLDAFENTTGDTGEKMKHLLKTAMELTSNALAMVTKLTDFLKTLEIPGISQGEGFVCRDLTIENRAGPAKHQAVALRITGDMAVVHNCHIDAYQDTLYTHSYRQFYRACTITGTIDFIFGNAAVVFQTCKMIVRKPMENQACMVTAQGRKDRHSAGGTVIQNCDILPDPALKATHPPVKVYLGRPWKQFSRTIIMSSFIDGFIAPEGWSPWEGDFALNTLWYAEYKNRGPGANTARRVNWKGIQKNISPQIARQFTPRVFLLEADTWIRRGHIPYFL
nr:pectinesterase-like [Ipomoea batatas]